MVDANSAETLVTGAKYVLLDCDGVLWRGKVAIPGAKEFLEKLNREGKQVNAIVNYSHSFVDVLCH